jgi:hypothetical protein
VRLKKVFKAVKSGGEVRTRGLLVQVGKHRQHQAPEGGREIGREMRHSKLAQKLLTKSTFGLPPHFTDEVLEEVIGWCNLTKTDGGMRSGGAQDGPLLHGPSVGRLYFRRPFPVAARRRSSKSGPTAASRSYVPPSTFLPNRSLRDFSN